MTGCRGAGAPRRGRRDLRRGARSGSASPARSAAASRRSPAGSRARGAVRSTPTPWPATWSSRASPRWRSSSRGSARRCRAADGTPRPGSARADRLRGPGRAGAISRRSSTRPSGRGSWRRSPRRTAAGAPAVVVEAIKLVEGGLAALCDEVWLVTCSTGRAAGRLAGRGVAADDAARRIAAQADMAERLAPMVTRVLDTSGIGLRRDARVDGVAAALAAHAGRTGGLTRSRPRRSAR